MGAVGKPAACVRGLEVQGQHRREKTRKKGQHHGPDQIPLTNRPRCESVKVDGQAQIHFEKAVYSLPVEFGRRRVDLLAFFDRIEIWDDLKIIGTWPRSYLGGEHYDYQHYLPLLKKAPCGCLNGKPYLTMPEVLLKYRTTLLAQLERRAACLS